MRKEKQFLLDEIEDQVKITPSFVIMRYQGLKANQAAAFRREVHNRGGHVEMLKKRLLVKAAQKQGISLELGTLEGHIGVVFGGEDFLETTKYVFSYGKGSEQAVDVIGGHYEGTIHNAQAMKTLSELPSKDEMRAQLLATLIAPMSHTIGTMDAILTSVLHCLQNKVDKE